MTDKSVLRELRFGGMRFGEIAELYKQILMQKPHEEFPATRLHGVLSEPGRVTGLFKFARRIPVMGLSTMSDAELAARMEFHVGWLTAIGTGMVVYEDRAWRDVNGFLVPCVGFEHKEYEVHSFAASWDEPTSLVGHYAWFRPDKSGQGQNFVVNLNRDDGHNVLIEPAWWQFINGQLYEWLLER